MEVKSINKNINFKSGLTRKIIKDILTTDVSGAEADFAKIGTKADFRGNKSICANFVYATNILYDLSEKYKLPFNFMPFEVKVYKNKELINPKDYFAFTINDTGKVLKDNEDYIGGSIFVNEKRNGLLANDYYTTKHYLLGRRSSPHFLANTLHEWFHAIHMDLIYKRYGYEGQCPILRQEYHNKHGLNKGLKKYDSLACRDMSIFPESFKKYIGKYAIKSNSMLEIFTELMTRITTESLDKNLSVIKNPLDNLPKDTPKEIKYELERIMDI